MHEDEKRLAAELKACCIPFGKKFKENDVEKSSSVLHRLGMHYRTKSPDKFSLIRSTGLLTAALIRKPKNARQIRRDLKELCLHILDKADAFDSKADLLQISRRCKQLAVMMREDVNQMLMKIDQLPWISFTTGCKTKRIPERRETSF